MTPRIGVHVTHHDLDDASSAHITVYANGRAWLINAVAALDGSVAVECHDADGVFQFAELLSGPTAAIAG